MPDQLIGYLELGSVKIVLDGRAGFLHKETV
jgi:hypothetical protein